MTTKDSTTAGATPAKRGADGIAHVTPATMLNTAIERGADVDQLERLMALHERWQADNRRSAFIEALADFQAAMPAIHKDGDVSYGSGGGKVGYRFASLPAIAQAIRKPLSDAGLTYRFEFANAGAGGEMQVTCVLTHTGGHAESTCMAAPPDTSGSKNAIQAEGSTATYLQRYTLKAALGIVDADEDIDGRGAGMGAGAEVITEDQADQLRKLLAQTPSGTGQKRLTWAQAESIADLPASMYAEAVATVKRKLTAADEELPL